MNTGVSDIPAVLWVDTDGPGEACTCLGAAPGPGPTPVLDGTCVLCGARNGDEAVELVQRQAGRVAAVFWAWGDAGLDGVQRVLALDPEARWVVVAPTDALEHAIEQAEGLFAQHGLDGWDWLARPFAPAQLRHRVRRALAAWHRDRQLLRQARSATLGELVAGVAHELNNPLAYVSSNLESLSRYVDKLKAYADGVAEGSARLVGHPEAGPVADELAGLRRRLKLDIVLGDMGPLIQQSSGGLGRMRRMVQELRAFAREEDQPRQVQLNDLLDGVLSLMHHELKRKVVERDFGALPSLSGRPSELGHALVQLVRAVAGPVEEGGQIRVRTLHEAGVVRVEVSGGQAEVQPVGGPAARVVRGHGGRLRVEAGPGAGATLVMELPVEPAE
jgi:signal transduction histidine kinase